MENAIQCPPFGSEGIDDIRQVFFVGDIQFEDFGHYRKLFGYALRQRQGAAGSGKHDFSTLLLRSLRRAECQRIVCEDAGDEKLFAVEDAHVLPLLSRTNEVGAKNYPRLTTVTVMAPNDSDSSTTPDGDRSGDRQELAALIGRLVSGKVAKQDMRRLVVLLGRYLRIGRKGVGLNGKGLADLLFYVAPRLPVRNIDGLHGAYGGVTGGTLAAQVIKSASRNSAAVGGITGALATAGELAPPLWVTLPVEILAETLLVTAIEMRMIAELHGVYDIPIVGDVDDRGLAIVEAWSTRRGVDMKRLSKNGRSELAGGGMSKHVSRVVKRKLMNRAARNLGTLAPLFLGAVIGAETNRRSTRDIGSAITHDLANKSPEA